MAKKEKDKYDEEDESLVQTHKWETSVDELTAVPPTEEDETVGEVLSLNPVAAGAMGLFLWGGGFLYIRKPLTASLILFSMLILATLFGALSGALPHWIGDFILQEVHWPFALAPSLVWVGSFLAMVWWVSMVIPMVQTTQILFRPFQPVRNVFALLATALFVPMISLYLQGKFWKGHILALAYLVLPVTLFSALRLWEFSYWTTLEESIKVEPFFLGFCGALGIALVIVLLGIINAFTGALHELGFLRSSFFLAIFLIGVGLFYAFLGPPGEKARSELNKLASLAQNQNLLGTSDRIQKFNRSWEQKAAICRDYLGLFE